MREFIHDNDFNNDFNKFARLRHQRLIKRTVLRVIKVRMMPEQGEIAAVTQSPLFEVPLSDH